MPQRKVPSPPPGRAPVEAAAPGVRWRGRWRSGASHAVPAGVAPAPGRTPVETAAAPWVRRRGSSGAVGVAAGVTTTEGAAPVETTASPGIGRGRRRCQSVGRLAFGVLGVLVRVRMRPMVRVPCSGPVAMLVQLNSLRCSGLLLLQRIQRAPLALACGEAGVILSEGLRGEGDLCGSSRRTCRAERRREGQCGAQHGVAEEGRNARCRQEE
mmetsp:Transcript_25405/g.80731  ORF Transcript_25405/g.80731 Transcript_25405/m.80731 type:complete len:212 (-) Transcript_25405:47-682(-)